MTFQRSLLFVGLSILLLFKPAFASSPNQILENLKQGNKSFSEGKPSKPRQDIARRIQLTLGQTPDAVVLTCSDSRTPPEILFDQGLGDLFVIRVAGNIINAGNIASVEYALDHLGTRLIIIMGHNSCGAIKAVLETPKEISAGSPSLDNLVETIRGNIKDGNDKDPVIANVNGVVKDLVAQSKIIREHLKKGDLLIVPAVYSFDTGRVSFWAAKTK